ncbi:MAG: orotidine-5'-phosphate decarboxylase [Candidatus Micrarchaeia archaeon]
MLGKLRSIAEENKTILCFGIDPVLEKIEKSGSKAENATGTLEEQISDYYCDITDELINENQISAIKPNYAYFAQYGFEGLKALKLVMEEYSGKLPIILDGKRGDIGRSSDAYAREVFDFWGADATTVSPYMGSDSVKPFVKDGKIVYMLCRTSNEGAKDFQELKVGKKPLYEHVAAKAAEWKTGLVVGATSDSIKKILKITGGKNVPLLIPGVGAQGGDLELVLKAIKNELPIHRINASSSIAFAYEKKGGNPVKAALAEAKSLNEKIGKFF